MNETLYGFKNIPIAAPSVRVLLEILEANPQIVEISHTTFNPDDSSAIEAGPNNPFHWLSRETITEDGLRTLSDGLFAQDSLEVEIDSGEFITLTNKALAITSKVRLIDGTVKHILMLDFDGVETLEDVLYGVSSYKGVLLSTGKPGHYHFIGLDLLSEDEWRLFMEESLAREFESQNSHEIIDVNYLESSLKRGFAALRVLGYPGTEKNNEPRVVAIIN